MTTRAAVPDLVGQFDHIMARHLVVRIISGSLCDQPGVWQCYVDTRCDLQMLPPMRPYPGNPVEAYYVAEIARRLALHRLAIDHMTAHLAREFIAGLLLAQR